MPQKRIRKTCKGKQYNESDDKDTTKKERIITHPSDLVYHSDKRMKSKYCIDKIKKKIFVIVGRLFQSSCIEGS